MEKDEDALWQEIVDNYDETSTDEGAPASEEALPGDPFLDDARRVDPVVDPPAAQEYAVPAPTPREPEEPSELRAWDDEGRYVPPPPEPIPLAEPPRLLGWLGLFLAPLIALVALVLGHPFRGLLALLLVAWFVGGFIYLVRTMPDDPREPWDDGSRV